MPDVRLDGDPTRLAQVVSNLLTNAAKYTERGGRIALAAGRDGGEVVVTVRDTGIGIPPDMLTRVFEMFAQVDGAPGAGAPAGWGSGCRWSRGWWRCTAGPSRPGSAGAGRGSEFIIRLPLLAGERPTCRNRPPGPAAPPTGGRLRILVVDDNDDAAESMATMLEMFGHEVRTALRRGGRRCGRPRHSARRVVLLDIGMPKVDGYEACRRIRGQPWGRGMVLIALTGWGQDEDRRQTRAAGFDHHLTKPVNPADLRKLLDGLGPSTAPE